MKNILISGAGIGGLCTAIALQRAGYQVKVYEAAPEIKPVGAGLVLAANAIRALRSIGIEQDVLARGKQLHKFLILDNKGKVIRRIDSLKISERYGLDNFAIHRAELHRILLDILPPGLVQLNKKVERAEQVKDEVVLHFADATEQPGDYLIAADGIHSPLRQQLLPGSKPRYAGYTCWRGIADMHDLPLDLLKAVESWGQGARFGFVPLDEHIVYWFACLNAPPNDPLMRNLSKEDLLKTFQHFHSPIPELIKSTPANRIIWNDILDIAPIRQFAFDRVLLLGDAAHATTPNMGQGACLAIEDAAVLAACMKKYAPQEAFKAFEKKRVDRAARIINTSKQLGQVAQIENKLLGKLRNNLIRLLPESINERQLQFLYHVDLENV